MAEHHQRRVGFEKGDTAMDHGIGVGVLRVDAECLRQTRAVRRLDRREAEALADVARRDEANPARAEHADAVVEDHVVVGPHPDRHRFLAATGPGVLSARSSSALAILTPASVSGSQWPSLPYAASTWKSTLPPPRR